MMIIAKSAWNYDEMADKLERGAHGLEVQLLSTEDEFFLPTTWKDEFIQCIYAVHMPLTKKIDGLKVSTDNYDIETVHGWNTFPIVCERAATLAKRVNHDIVVVVHVDTETESLKRMDIWDKTVDLIRSQAKRYPQVVIAIENTTRLLRQPLTCVDLANAVNEPNVGNCLDTCHAAMTTQQTRLMSLMGIKFMPFEAFFTRMQKTVKWMHLCDAVDLGQGFGIERGHGYPFILESNDSMKQLEHIMWQYKTLNYTCPICLEVQEIDYSCAINFTVTKEALEAMCKRLNLPVDAPIV